MKMPTLAAALLLAAPASAAVLDAPFHVVPPDVHGVQYAPRFEPDCRHVVFQPEDPSVSRPMTLTSEEWITDCVPAGAGGGQSCWEHPGRTDSLAVSLSLADRRPLLPWESDVFSVCLQGPALRTQPVSTAYDYRVVNDGALDGRVVLEPGAKRALPPDPRGVQATLTPQLTLAFHDLWSSYYAGQEILLRIALRKANDFFPDETVAEKEIALPVAENYAVELSRAAGAGGGIYYARYSIRRLGGAVSTEDETPVLETEKVSYSAR
ncbi:MAG TPA: hypothetical protein VH309_09740 [Elusimicrobiota bacterium]|nr:hypothetical protein [Elusimicrobiota bacterium]